MELFAMLTVRRSRGAITETTITRRIPAAVEITRAAVLAHMLAQLPRGWEECAVLLFDVAPNVIAFDGAAAGGAR